MEGNPAERRTRRLPVGVTAVEGVYGTTYEARWYDSSGRRRSATFDTAREAAAYREEQMAARRRGGTGDPSGGRVRLSEWWEKWIGTTPVRPSTRARLDSMGRVWIIPHLGGYRLGKLRPSDIAGFRETMNAAGLAPASVERVMRGLSTSLRGAVAEGLIAKNPASGVRPPKRSGDERRFLTPDELARLESVMDPHWSLIVPFLADTGLRIGELSALRVKDVDLLAGSVTVSGTAVYLASVNGARRSVAAPKTASGRRVVPTLTRGVCERLALQIAERGQCREDWLFTGRRRGPLAPDVWRAVVWRPAVREAELEEPLPTPHSLRHTAVALWIAAGVTDPLKLTRWAGHASVSTTYNTYGHLLPMDATETRDALEAMRAGAAGPVGTVRVLAK